MNRWSNGKFLKYLTEVLKYKLQYVSKKLQDILNIFFQIISTILLCTNIQFTLMLVDGCNLAQLNAWAYRAMYFNCVALQVVNYFLRDENLLCTYM